MQRKQTAAEVEFGMGLKSFVHPGTVLGNAGYIIGKKLERFVGRQDVGFRLIANQVGFGFGFAFTSIEAFSLDAFRGIIRSAIDNIDTVLGEYAWNDDAVFLLDLDVDSVLFGTVVSQDGTVEVVME